MIICLDGDDTLWHNERIFSMTESRFCELLKPWSAGDATAARLLETERRNLGILGYGVKAFTLSMVETAIEISEGAVPASTIASIIEAGKLMLEHPVELLDGVAEAVPTLAARWTLVLLTKGDLFHQESKLARSGLLPHLSRVEIVSEKDDATYVRLVSAVGVAPDEFVMVGDSMKSDIVPALAAGCRAVHIPGYRVWELERADDPPGLGERWWRIPSIAALADLVTKMHRP